MEIFEAADPERDDRTGRGEHFRLADLRAERVE